MRLYLGKLEKLDLDEVKETLNKKQIDFVDFGTTIFLKYKDNHEGLNLIEKDYFVINHKDTGNTLIKRFV